MADKVFVSPGVYTSERDLSFVAQSVGVTTLGIVGETQSGPAFEPIFITNFDEFTAYFGGTSPTKFINTQIPKYEAAYIAKAYLQQSNQLFVTRILGLSGYDAGPAWSISTVGNLKKDTVVGTGNAGPFTVTFSGVSGTSASTTITNYSDLPGYIEDYFSLPYTTFSGGVSTIEDDFKTSLYKDIVDPSNSGKTAYMFGTVSGGTYDTITGTSNWTGSANVLDVDGLTIDTADFEASKNDSWYYSLFPYDSTDQDYSGVGFGLIVTGLTNTSGNNYTGTAVVYDTTYSGTVITDYHNMVISTLRSRGISTYSNDDGPVYEVSGLTDVTINSSAAYSGITNNPFATFQLSGVTSDSETFTFDTSFTLSDPNFLSKVLGQSNFGKDRNEVPLMVGELYYNLLNTGYR